MVEPSRTCSTTAGMGLPRAFSTNWRGLSTDHLMSRTWSAWPEAAHRPLPAARAACSSSCSRASSGELRASWRTVTRPSDIRPSTTFSPVAASVHNNNNNNNQRATLHSRRGTR